MLLLHIKHNLIQLEEEISKALEKSHRKREEISVIAVSKTFPVEYIKEALEQGQYIFGENKVQEAETKKNLLGNISPFEYHLIGHLQSNKVNKAVDCFSTIQTIDSISLARKINQSCEKINKIMSIFLQINTSEEEQKSGILYSDYKVIMDLVENIQILSFLKLEGLMTIGPNTMEEKGTKHCFERLRNLKDEVNKNFSLQIPHLSMGMSNDFKWAIEEGATLLRIGSAIFGNRSYHTL